MKLKFYLRGLGIGIVVTALTMGIATRDKLPLTDAEIKAAAAKLGMVESDSLKLSDLNQDGEDSDLPPEGTGEPEPGTDPDTDGGTATPEPDSDPDADDGTATPEPDSDPVAQVPEMSSGITETVTITIRRGTGSRAVCSMLADAGLIEDAAAFDQYLIDSGYSKRISAGTFEIPAGASEEEMAKIISKSR